MTSDKGKAFWLGIFVIIAIGTVAWLFLFLKPTVGDGKTILRIRFTNVEGVSIGTRVNFGGKPVGTVYEIKEIYNARSSKPDQFGNYYFYEVVAHVDSRVKIYSYDEIALTTQGLLGEKSIEITPKAAPPGAKPPQLITTDILYARSGDQLQAAIQDFSHVLTKVSNFLDYNTPLVQDTLETINAAAKTFNCFMAETLSLNLPCRAGVAADAVTCAMKKTSALLDSVQENQLPKRFADVATSFKDVGDSFKEVVNKLSHGNGTLAKLINSDCFYLQLTATLCKLETVLSDISNYGLLFQYDRKWQRQRVAKVRQMEQICNAQGFRDYMNQEMQEISCSLDRVSRALSKSEECAQEECYNECYRELLNRVEHLRDTLRNYNEMKGACD